MKGITPTRIESRELRSKPATEQREPQMNRNNFGPWATSISHDGNAQASTLWRKRLKMLSRESQVQSGDKRCALWLGACAITVLSLPTWHRPSEETPQTPTGCADTTSEPTN